MSSPTTKLEVDTHPDDPLAAAPTSLLERDTSPYQRQARRNVEDAPESKPRDGGSDDERADIETQGIQEGGEEDEGEGEDEGDEGDEGGEGGEGDEGDEGDEGGEGDEGDERVGEDEGEGAEEEHEGFEEDYDEDDGSEWSDTPPPQYVLQRGGRAARKVYDSLEIRHRILVLTDRPTLARMLRLERAVSASVARVLYKSVNKAVMAKMSRANTPNLLRRCPRRRPKPSPSLFPSEKRPFPSERRTIYFDHHEATKLVTAGRKKFPNLQRIDYLYPSHDVDDAWSICIRAGGKITVDLERHVEFDLHDVDEFNPDPPVLPAPPRLPEGMGIRYTIAIKLIAQDQDSHYYWAEHKKDLPSHLKKWHDWLYLNPDLDRRVTSIQRWLFDYNSDRKYRYPPIYPFDAPSIVDPTLDEALAFLAQRKRDNCKTMSAFTIPQSRTSISPERFREIIAMLPTELRSLRIHKSIIQNLPSTQTAIAAFDAAFPNLQQLAILHDAFQGEKPPRSYVEPTPLSGLPNLRNFFSTIQMPGGIDAVHVARFVCRLGTDKCVHQNKGIPSMQGMKRAADEVREVKPYVLDKRTYRYGDGYAMYADEEGAQIEPRETECKSEWGSYWILE